MLTDAAGAKTTTLAYARLKSGERHPRPRKRQERRALFSQKNRTSMPAKISELHRKTRRAWTSMNSRAIDVGRETAMLADVRLKSGNAGRDNELSLR
jgi:hypothetical protein